MAGWYNLEIPQIEFALAYIEEHREEVERDYQRIKERHARGNSPEIRAKIEESRKRLAERWPQFRARPASHEENGDGRHSAGH
jgi:hypothetical protein